MVIYLRHPRHGTKVAISETEAVADIAHGWERFDPTVKPDQEPKKREKKQEPEAPKPQSVVEI